LRESLKNEFGRKKAQEAQNETPNIFLFFLRLLPAPSAYEPVASAYECAARIQAMRMRECRVRVFAAIIALCFGCGWRQRYV